MPRNRTMVAIVFLTFFVMSLLTNILGMIVPDIIGSFKVSLAAAAFHPLRVLHRLRNDVGTCRLSGRTLSRKISDDRRIRRGNSGIAQLWAAPQLSRRGDFAVHHRIGNGHPADGQ
jgi:hypothetical protein